MCALRALKCQVLQMLFGSNATMEPRNELVFFCVCQLRGTLTPLGAAAAFQCDCCYVYGLSADKGDIVLELASDC